MGNANYPLEYGYDSYNQRTTLKTYQQTTGWDSPTWPDSPGAAAVTTWHFEGASGALYRKTDAGGSHTHYSYYPGGQLKRRTWARGTYVEYSYSLDGLLTGRDYSDDTPDVIYRRGRLGQILSITDAAGVVQFDHDDERGLLDAERYTSGLLKGYTISRGYDDYGRPDRVSVKNGDDILHNVGYIYEPITGGLDKVKPSSTWEIDYIQDQASGRYKGAVHKHNDSSYLVEDRIFDASGALDIISYTSGSSTPLSKYDYGLDGFGRRDNATLLDGSHWDYDYDSRGQLTSAVKKTPAGAVVLGSHFEADYDGIGNPDWQKKGGGHSGGALRHYDFSAGLLNQISRTTPMPPPGVLRGKLEVLGDSSAATVTVNGITTTRQGSRYGIEVPVDNDTGAQQVTLNIEATDGATTTSKTVKRSLAAADQFFIYDQDGNLLSDGIWHYTWDAENRLIEAVYLLAQTDADKRKLHYTYDHQSRRILRRELRWNTARNTWYAERQIKYLYDGWNCIAEILNESTLWKKHTWGLDLSGSTQGAGGVGGLLTTEDLLNGYAASVLYDGNGNVVGLVEKGTQNLIAEYEYTAFGETLTAKGAMAQANTYRFSTKPLDAQTGLYYYGERYYNPNNGRWLSRDPIEEDGGPNLYGFCYNAGVNLFDNLGNAPMSGWGAGGSLNPSWNHDYHQPRNSGQSDSTLIDAMDIMESLQRAPCMIQCQILGMTEEDWDEILGEVVDVALTGNPQGAVGNAAVIHIRRSIEQAPDNAARAAILFGYLRAAIIVSQGKVEISKNPVLFPASVRNRAAQEALIKMFPPEVRSKVAKVSIRKFGPKAVKVAGMKVIPKVVPYVGPAGWAYEGLKCCWCLSVCEDKRYTSTDKFWSATGANGLYWDPSQLYPIGCP